MRVDEEPGRWCARTVIAVGLLLTICAADALAQSPEQKPAESYQTYYLKNATGINAASDIQTTLRNMVPRARIYYAPAENALSLAGSAEDLARAQKILMDIDRPQKTYRVTYSISEGAGQVEGQRFVLIVTPGGKSISKQGTRVPIMTGAYKEGEGASANTQFQYVDIGVSVEASLAGFEDGMRLHSKIEQSSVADEKSNVGIQDPVIKQSVLEVQSAFVPGKPLTIGSVEMPGGKRVQVQATVEAVQ
jgi:hypothetical protein